jgi:hypothetical protein
MTEHTTETKIGNTVYIVKAECSATAVETVENKLERLICRHITDTKSYQTNCEIPLAIYSKVRDI